MDGVDSWKTPAEGVRVARIGVVVPVNDEESTLQACLAALVDAVGCVDVPVDIIVVLDACTDRSALVAGGFSGRGVDAITLSAKSVGCARAAGMAEVVRRRGGKGLWLATTDGDTLVPPDWLAAQLRHADLGARVVAGTVRVDDWSERSDAVRQQAMSDYAAGPHRHVHGANLAFESAAYCRAGGFDPVRCHEDVRLVEKFRANGESIAWATDMPVVTSARRDARAPLGFGTYLSDLEVSLGDVRSTL